MVPKVSSNKTKLMSEESSGGAEDAEMHDVHEEPTKESSEGTQDGHNGPELSARSQRRIENKSKRFMGVRLSLETVCRSPLMREKIEEAVQHLSLGMTIAVKILQTFVSEQVAAKKDVCIQQTTIKHCIDIAGGKTDFVAKKAHVPESKLDFNSLNARRCLDVAKRCWFDHLPVGYEHPNVDCLGNNGKQYLAKEFLTNIKNHITLNFPSRHRHYVTSVVGRWFDALETKPEKPTVQRHRAIRTVIYASLCHDCDDDPIREMVQTKRRHFLIADQPRKASDPIDWNGESVNIVEETTEWLKSQEDALTTMSEEIRRLIPIINLEDQFKDENLFENLAFFHVVQQRQEFEQAQETPLRKFHAMALLPDKSFTLGDVTIDDLTLKILQRSLNDVSSQLMRNKFKKVWKLMVDARQERRDHVKKAFVTKLKLKQPTLTAKEVLVATKAHMARWQEEHKVGIATQEKRLEGAFTRKMWNHYFCLEKAKRNGWKMDRLVSTDGVSATVRMWRPLRPNEHQKVKDNDDFKFRWRDVNTTQNAIIGLDPGRAELFNCSKVELVEVEVEEEEEEAEEETKDEDGDEKMAECCDDEGGGESGEKKKRKTKWVLKPDYDQSHRAKCRHVEFKSRTGVGKAEKKRANDMKANPLVQSFETDMPSLRSSDATACVAHLIYCARSHIVAVRYYRRRWHREDNFNRRAISRPSIYNCICA
jgi:hypothetical protein